MELRGFLAEGLAEDVAEGLLEENPEGLQSIPRVRLIKRFLSIPRSTKILLHTAKVFSYLV